MLDVLFGADMPLAPRLVIALAVVVGLLGATTWMIHRRGTQRLDATSTRGRQPHLAVIDVAAVDARRRLILIRRDSVEHLMLIGGPSDVVIEANIVPPATPREEQAARRPAAGDTLPEAVPLGEGGIQPPGPGRAQRRPARSEPAPRQSEQVLRAEPPMRPQPLAPPPSLPAERGRVDDRLARLAETLERTPQSNTHASEPRAPRRELAPLPTPRHEARMPPSQPMPSPPSPPGSAQPPGPRRPQ
jgi:flagellar protein FliO/FliZ